MSTESCPVPLTQLLGHSQMARRRQVVNPAPVVQNAHPTAPETTSQSYHQHRTSHKRHRSGSEPSDHFTALQAYCRWHLPTAQPHDCQPLEHTASAVYATSTSRSRAAIACLQPQCIPGRASTVQHDSFIGSNTTGRKKALHLAHDIGRPPSTRMPHSHIPLCQSTPSHTGRKTQLSSRSERIHAARVRHL